MILVTLVCCRHPGAVVALGSSKEERVRLHSGGDGHYELRCQRSHIAVQKPSRRVQTGKSTSCRLIIADEFAVLSCRCLCNAQGATALDERIAQMRQDIERTKSHLADLSSNNEVRILFMAADSSSQDYGIVIRRTQKRPLSMNCFKRETRT